MASSGGREFSVTLMKANTSYGRAEGMSSWMSSTGKGSGWGGDFDGGEKGKGSPVDGVVQSGALITHLMPMELARPEKERRNSFLAGSLDEGGMSHNIWNRFDAQIALRKDMMQINGVQIVGVKSIDPMQRQALSERINNQGFIRWYEA